MRRIRFYELRDIPAVFKSSYRFTKRVGAFVLYAENMAAKFCHRCSTLAFKTLSYEVEK